MKEILKKLNTRHRRTTPYHPRTNGLVERLNGVLGHSVAKYLVGKPRKMWDLYLDNALYHARVRTHSTTEQSPFYMLYGVHPRLIVNDVGPMPETDAVRDDPGPMLETTRAEAQRLTELRDKQNKRYYDSERVKKTSWKVGD
jgi:transposase InsO family protein